MHKGMKGEWDKKDRQVGGRERYEKISKGKVGEIGYS